MRTGSFVDFVSGLIAAAGGGYLLAHGSPSIAVGGESGQSWLEVLAHGIGVYFIARGIWMMRHGWSGSRDVAERLDRLIELAESRVLPEHGGGAVE